ncbi:MAG: hypothetical protein ABIF40_00290 [archaeon]
MESFQKRIQNLVQKYDGQIDDNLQDTVEYVAHRAGYSSKLFDDTLKFFLKNKSSYLQEKGTKQDSDFLTELALELANVERYTISEQLLSYALDIECTLPAESNDDFAEDVSQYLVKDNLEKFLVEEPQDVTQHLIQAPNYLFNVGVPNSAQRELETWTARREVPQLTLGQKLKSYMPKNLFGWATTGLAIGMFGILGITDYTGCKQVKENVSVENLTIAENESEEVSVTEFDLEEHLQFNNCDVDVYMKRPIQRTVVITKKTKDSVTKDSVYEMSLDDVEKLNAYIDGEPMSEEVPLEFLEEVLDKTPSQRIEMSLDELEIYLDGKYNSNEVKAKVKIVDEDMKEFMQDYQQNKRSSPKFEIGSIHDTSSVGGGDAGESTYEREQKPIQGSE